MSNDIIPANLQVPAHIAQMTSTLSDAVGGGLTTGAPPRISTKAGRFRLVEDGAEEVLDTLSLNVVLVGANPNVSKTYYERDYNEDNAEAPDCFSNNGVTPDASVAHPQAKRCVDCPQNVWGSKISKQTGKDIKACADRKLLAVVPVQDITGTIYQLSLAPTSLRNLAAYNNELKRRKVAIEGVATKVSFDPNASHPLLQFSFSRFLDASEAAQVGETLANPRVHEVVNVTEAPADAPQAAPEPEPTPVQETPAPKAATSKFGDPEPAKAAPAGKASKFGGDAQTTAPEVVDDGSVVAKGESGGFDYSEFEKELEDMSQSNGA